MSEIKARPVKETFVLEQSNADPNEWRVFEVLAADSPGVNPYRYFKSEKDARKYVERKSEEARKREWEIRLGWSIRE